MYVLLIICVSAVSGVILTLIVQWFLLRYYLSRIPYQGPPTEPTKEDFRLPEVLKDLLQDGKLPKKESCWAFNLVLQFLFKEVKNTERVRKWFLRKLSLEFEEVLTKTTTGKLFDRVAIRLLNLGNEFPIVKGVEVTSVQLHPVRSHIETLDLCLDVEYLGGFQLAVDANMKLGRSAYLSVKVLNLVGKARLQFARYPYAHWSFSFINDPVIEVKVESQFQGRPLSQINSLITNQIRKSVRKKHTLPNFKLRYKPFFTKCNGGTVFATPDATHHVIPKGKLLVTVVECSRLPEESLSGNIYCTLAVDKVPWVDMVHFEPFSAVTLDLNIAKAQSQSLGLIFKQIYDVDRAQTAVLVDSVCVDSSAAAAGVRPKDLLTAVDGRPVKTISEALRRMKASREKFSVRVERRSVLRIAQSPVQQPSSKADQSMSQAEISTLSEDSADLAPPVVMTSVSSPASPAMHLRKRRGSPESLAKDRVIADADSSSSQSSVASSPSKRPGIFNRARSDEPAASTSRRSSAEESSVKGRGSLTENITVLPTSLSAQNLVIDEKDDKIPKQDEWEFKTELKNTTEKTAAADVIFDETIELDIQEHHCYMNMCVWSRQLEQTEPVNSKSIPISKPTFTKDILIGRINIPLDSIAAECSTTTMGHFIKDYLLCSPDQNASAGTAHKLSTHSGFEPSMCYGDVTLSFIYKPEGGSFGLGPEEVFVPTVDGSSPKRGSVGQVLPGLTRQHDFLRTHFHSATQCEFCKKKIWLKDAYQCRTCAMTCHKKCVVKCQTNTNCTIASAKGRDGLESDEGAGGDDFIHVEISKPDSLDLGQPTVRIVPTSPQVSRRSVSSFLASVASAAKSGSNMKRVGSATNLAPPNSSGGAGLSRSLPPSPQHSPTSSRKASLTANPFELLDQLGAEDDFSAAVDQLIQNANEERLVAAAKETGKDIYADLSLSERKEKLNFMLAKLQAEVDKESEHRLLLSKKTQMLVTPTEKTKLSLEIAKSEEKVQALAVLMLYYCTGLQHVQDLEETLLKEVEKVTKAPDPLLESPGRTE